MMANNWREVDLGEICEFAYGKSLPAKKRSGSGFPVFGSNGKVGLHEKALTDGATIIIGRKGSFGEVHFSSEPCSPIDTTYYITENQTGEYLPWLARRLRCLDLDRLNRAAAVPGLNRSDAYRQRLLLPPISEQKRIAEILDAADALRYKRREALDKSESFIQSTFLDMFGDPVANPYEWDSLSFGELIVEGPQNGIYKPLKLYGSGVNILRIDGFYDGRVTGMDSLRRVQVSEKEVEKYGLSEGDVVINRVNSRSHLGKCALIPKLDEPVVFESNMMRLRLDEDRILPQFAAQFLQTQYVKNQVLTACKDAVNQSSINQTDVKGFQVLVPPTYLQYRFAIIVESIEQQKACMRSHLAELDALFASLQYRAFNGEL